MVERSDIILRSVNDVPTIYHRVCFLLVGTRRVIPPEAMHGELICFARKRNFTQRPVEN
jgi:hypothetical protein